MTSPTETNPVPADGRIVEYSAMAEGDNDMVWAPGFFGVPYSAASEAAAVQTMVDLVATLPGGHLTSLSRTWADDDGVEYRDDVTIPPPTV